VSVVKLSTRSSMAEEQNINYFFFRSKNYIGKGLVERISSAIRREIVNGGRTLDPERVSERLQG
jgi:hypothetical protein